MAGTNYRDNTWSLTEANSAGQLALILAHELATLIGKQEIEDFEPGGHVTVVAVNAGRRLVTHF